MVDFLPSTIDSVADEERDPRVVGVDSEDADKLVSALSSETGRRILSALYEEPATPAALAERVDTSLQNVQYHLGKLEDGNLVEVADTAYSEKGREMNVYAPVAEPLVLFAGNESDTVGLKSALSNLLGGLGILGLASLVVQRLATGNLLPFGSSSNSGGNSGSAVDYTQTGGGGSSDKATTVAETAGRTTAETAERTTTAAETSVTDATTEIVRETTTQSIADGAMGAGIPPGLLFFLGGALILVLGFAVWYRRAS